MEKTVIGFVPLSRRQIVRMPDGTELERQMLYMHRDTWAQLRDLCIRSKLGCSRVIAQLIEQAHQE